MNPECVRPAPVGTQTPSDPDSSPTSSTSTMTSLGPESPPSKLAAAPPAALKQPAVDAENASRAPRQPSPVRALPLRSKDFNTPAPPQPQQLDSSPSKGRLKNTRNLRNLAVRTNIRSSAVEDPLATAHMPGSFAAQNRYRVVTSPSVPSSPTKKMSLPPLRKKAPPLGLTIQTPTAENNMNGGGVPLTPLTISRATHLRHYKSSPSLNTRPYPPPPPRPPIEDFAPSGMAVVEEEDEEESSDIYEPNFDVPQSQEEPQDAYPDGPMPIFQSGVDLYLEPTREIASTYDVVINVAVEVLNPFNPSKPPMSLAKFRANRSIIQGPIEVPHTPGQEKIPEYIHLPWEHNTEIVEDLKILVQLISNRVSSGKRVLIHCQCGVSRSASLIVAYGMYQCKTRSVQSMYNAVKRRSRWICPNMSLIMQLQEFHTVLNTPGGLNSHHRRISDDNVSAQSVVAPANFGVPAPLRTAPPRSGLRTGSRTYFDLTSPPPIPVDVASQSPPGLGLTKSPKLGMGSPRSGMGSPKTGSLVGSPPVRQKTPSLAGTPPTKFASVPRPLFGFRGSGTSQSPEPAGSERSSDAGSPPQSRIASSPMSSPSRGFKAVAPPAPQGLPLSFLNPAMASISSPRTDTFSFPLQQIHNSVANSIPNNRSPSLAPAKVSGRKMASISPSAAPSTADQSSGLGFAPISQGGASDIFRRKRPDANIKTGSPTSAAVGVEDPRSPVQGQHSGW